MSDLPQAHEHKPLAAPPPSPVARAVSPSWNYEAHDGAWSPHAAQERFDSLLNTKITLYSFGTRLNLNSPIASPQGASPCAPSPGKRTREEEPAFPARPGGGFMMAPQPKVVPPIEDERMHVRVRPPERQARRITFHHGPSSDYVDDVNLGIAASPERSPVFTASGAAIFNGMKSSFITGRQCGP